jgi:glycosyltransferase 2 family protein
MAATARHVRRTAILLAKLTLAAAILAYLVVQVQHHEGFARLVQQPKHWSLLALGLVAALAAIGLSFVRWHTLVRALGLEFRLRDAMRLGSLGFALNFVALGTLGGDLFKAVFLAREQPGRRTAAVASVMADRLLGLLVMLLLASGGILAAGLRHSASLPLVMLSNAILLATVVGGTGAGLMLFVPGLLSPRMVGWVEAVPWVGPTAHRLIDAVRAYREQKPRLLLAGAICLAVDLLFVLSFYMVARGLPVHAPSLAEHLVIVPVANMAGAIPATPNGLGTMEATVELLYQAVPGGERVEPGDGTLVTLAHRLTLMTVALVGLLYYVSRRSDLRELIAEAEEMEEA